MEPNTCPPLDQLEAFALGNLPERSMHRIVSHLAQCNRCDAQLSKLDGYSDQLTNQLRHVDRTEAAELNDQLATLASSVVQVSPELRSAAQTWSTPGGDEAVLSSQTCPYRIGKFQFETKLGEGSFGEVFRAHDTLLDRTVAIKIQRPGMVADQEQIQRFQREARSAAQLKHPTIVSLYETGQTDEGVFFLVNEYVDGKTLESTLETGRLDFWQVARDVAELAEALHYAHQKGVIHRDIKPSNIIIDQQGKMHLADFGLAKLESGEDTMTTDGQVLGTPAYMSPEQAQGETSTIDARTDIYSLGVVLYEMLTGQRPFRGNRRMLLYQVLDEDPPSPRKLDDRIPRDLEVICLKAMAKSPDRRYQNGEEFANDLRRFENHEPIHARPIGNAERLWRWCRRYPVAAMLFLTVTLGSVIGFAYLSWLSEYFVEQTALDSAKMQSEMFDEINAYYSDMVRTLDPEMMGTSGHPPFQGRVPFPASFTIEAGRRISQSETGMQVRLYSNYPFPWREDGGPPDQFAQTALDKLQKAPNRPVYEFTEVNGRRVVRYATARVLTGSCIRCHNTHPQSPKTDWQIGDVRGVLEIVRPLDRDIKRTRAGLRGSFAMIGSVSALLATVGVLALLNGRSRRRKSVDASR